jgi:hypothetical protein
MKGKIFETNLMGIGQKRDFYKLKELNPDDFALIKKIAVDTAPNHLQRQHENLMKQFDFVFQLRKLTKSRGINDHVLNNHLDIAIHNLEENLHAGIENETIKYIESILQEDIEFYNTDEGCMDFIYFLCVQYMRTEKSKNSVLTAFSHVKTVNFEKIWNVLSHIFATNMGWVLYAGRKFFKMILLKNETSKELITGDQPVVNTYADIDVCKTPPNDIELYYPVSPKIAILISQKKEYKGIRLKLLNENDVVSYNNLIIGNSHRQVYATSANILGEYNRK